MDVLIIRNEAREGHGLIADVLRENSLRFEVADIESSPDPGNYSALIVMGGPASANDETSKMKSELAMIKKAVAHGIPYLGICLGMQALVKALGGEVVKNRAKEVGWKDPSGKKYTIELTRSGIKDALFTGLPNQIPIFQLHGETVVLGKDITLLATGEHCRAQAIKINDKAYGLQGHVELTSEMFLRWCKEDPDLGGLDQAEIKKEYALLKESYEANGKRLISNFLKIAGLI